MGLTTDEIYREFIRDGANGRRGSTVQKTIHLAIRPSPEDNKPITPEHVPENIQILIKDAIDFMTRLMIQAPRSEMPVPVDRGGISGIEGGDG